MKERLRNWLRNTNKALARRWWWLLVLFIADKVWGLFEHRIYSYINAAIDAHSAEYLKWAKPHILYIVTNPIWVSILVLLLVVGGIVLHAYLDTLKTDDKDKPQHPPDSTTTPQLVIKSARYGVGTFADHDIADRLNAKPREALAFYVDNGLIAGLPDPAPNLPPGKRLHVTYLYGGDPNPHSALRNEHEFMVLPEDPKVEQLQHEVDGLTMQLGTARSTAASVGLTFDTAEVETFPDNSPVQFKFKLRVYWTNDGDETIHLGKPIWRGVAIQGNDLTCRYQLRHNQRTWGDETDEADVSPGRRCRIWLGLDPSLRDSAAKLLDLGQLGLLVVPVTTPQWSVDICIRPRDRGLKQFDAQEYTAQKKAVYDRYIVLSQEAKALLSFIRMRRVSSEADAVRHFQQYDLPNPDKALSDLRNDSVPFLASPGPEIKLNPILEKVISETVKADDADFLQAVDKMTGDAFGYRIKDESGFKGRYNALVSKQPW